MPTTALKVSMLLFSMWSLVMVVPELGAQETPARQQDDRLETAAKPIRLRMTPAVACRAIDGFEQYEILPGAALTAEEKLLVYYRPLDYTTVQKDDFFKAHLTQDGQVRRRGEKTVLLRKKSLLDYEPKSRNPLGPIYLRNSFSLKGLTPGEYEYDIILRDENEPGPPAIQSLKFRVVAPVPPELEPARAPSRPAAR
jgi:hypothetical protein